jgi:hypothetical protein
MKHGSITSLQNPKSREYSGSTLANPSEDIKEGVISREGGGFIFWYSEGILILS